MPRPPPASPRSSARGTRRRAGAGRNPGRHRRPGGRTAAAVTLARRMKCARAPTGPADGDETRPASGAPPTAEDSRDRRIRPPGGESPVDGFRDAGSRGTATRAGPFPVRQPANRSARRVVRERVPPSACRPDGASLDRAAGGSAAAAGTRSRQETIPAGRSRPCRRGGPRTPGVPPTGRFPPSGRPGRSGTAARDRPASGQTPSPIPIPSPIPSPMSSASAARVSASAASRGPAA